MGKQILADLRLYRADLLTVLIAALIGAAVGLPLAIVMHNDGWYFCCGTLLLMVVGLIAVFFGGFQSYPMEFQLALSMGRTRKEFLVSFGLRLLLQLLTVWLLAALFYGLERAVFAALAPDSQNELSFGFLYSWISLPVLAAVGLVTWTLGALYGAYGRKGLWAFYAVWMFCCLVLPRMFADTEDGGMLNRFAMTLRRVLGTLPPAALWIAAVLLFLAMPVTILRLAKNQTVKI